MTQDTFLSSYVINRKTLFVGPYSQEDTPLWTLVEEEGQMFVVTQNPFNVVDYSCRQKGSSLLGRKEGAKELLQETHKLSICVDPIAGIYLFPTASYTGKDCSWISHAHVKCTEKGPHNDVLVTFKNGEIRCFPISKGSFDRQYYRAGNLRHKMEALSIEGDTKSYRTPAQGPLPSVQEIVNPYLIKKKI